MHFLEQILFFILEHKLKFFIYISVHLFNIVITLYATRDLTNYQRCKRVFKNTLILLVVQVIRLVSTTL